MNADLAALEKDVTADDAAAVSAAILTAYPDKDVLYALLLSTWGVRVSDVIYVGQPGALAVAALVDWARAQGRTLDLLALTWSDRHREYHPLALLADRLIRPVFPPSPLESALPIGRSGLKAMKGLTPSLETLLPFGDDAVAADQPELDVLAVSGSMCLVDVDGRRMATGFLIGRQHVLTVHHVVREAIDAGLAGDRILLKFGGQGGREPVTLRAAPGSSWVGPLSPVAEFDVAGILPAIEGPDHLDFAVIRLAAPAPADRPPLSLPTHVPIVPPGDRMVVLHHALGQELQIATGRLIGYSLAGERVTYEADTAPGSAGAPVFTAAGDLIALHHAAQMTGDRRIAQGVPIWRIRQAIAAAGLDPKAL